MIRIASIILLCNLWLNSVAQTNLDSLYNVWIDKSQPDSVRLKAIYRAALKAKKINMDSGVALLDEAVVLALKTHNTKALAKSYYSKGAWYWTKNQDTAIVYLNKAKDEFKKVDQKKKVSDCLLYLGAIYRDRGDYNKAVDLFTESVILLEDIGDLEGVSLSRNNIGVLYLDQGFHDEAEVWFKKSQKAALEAGSAIRQSAALVNLSLIEEYRKNSNLALNYLSEAMDLRKGLNDGRGVSTILLNIANILRNEEQYDSAIVYLNEALALADSVGFVQGQEKAMNMLGSVTFNQADFRASKRYSHQALNLAKLHGNIKEIRDASERLYLINKQLGKNDDALRDFELYVLMKDSLKSESNRRSIIRQEFKYQYEKEALTDSLEFSKREAIMTERSEKQQMGLFAAGGSLLLLLALAFAIYSGKKKSDELLLNILPAETAEELKQKGHSDAKLIDEVTVLFTDFKGFTSLSEQFTPKELVADLHACFSEFDWIMEKYGIEKIKTIGDAYMAAGGLPSPNDTHAQDVVKAALEMAKVVEKGKAKKIEQRLPFFEIRIGVHTGPVVAGIVGVKKFQYDIWGDTVNTASRMESSGEVGKVNISQSTYQLLKEDKQFNFENRGKVAAKGKGEMEMFFVDKV